MELGYRASLKALGVQLYSLLNSNRQSYHRLSWPSAWPSLAEATFVNVNSTEPCDSCSPDPGDQNGTIHHFMALRPPWRVGSTWGRAWDPLWDPQSGGQTLGPSGTGISLAR